MRGKRSLHMLLAVTAVIILLPAIIILIWSVTARWPWPGLIPESLTLRTITELATGSHSIVPILGSSAALAGIVAAVSTTVAVMTARATEIYRIRGRRLIGYASMLPLLVPGTVFAMGIQVTLIRLGLNDSLTGVVIVHVVAALPYSIAIMTDVTAAAGDRLEEQAAILGASPARAFSDVSLPQLVPGILSSVSMSYIISYSQYFTTLLAGGGKIKTLSLVLVPYIQSGDRSLASVYSVTFVGSALLVFFLLEWGIHRAMRTGSGSKPMR